MKTIVRLVTLCAALIVSGSAFAQQYPSKPVRVVVPFPPGGVTDTAGRLIAQKLSERLGHQFYIENISGAGGNIGMANAARSPGDGYTILLSSSSIVVNPSLYNNTTLTRTSSRSPRPAPRRIHGSSIQIFLYKR